MRAECCMMRVHIYKTALETFAVRPPVRDASDSLDVDLFPRGTNNEVVFALLQNGRTHTSETEQERTLCGGEINRILVCQTTCLKNCRKTQIQLN